MDIAEKSHFFGQDKPTLSSLLGLAGVSEKENARAQFWGRFFNYLVIIALLVVVVELILAYSDNALNTYWVTEAVWWVFALEYLVCISLVDNRLRYFRQNWMNGLIVLLAFPWIPWQGDWALVFRSLRFILLIRIFSSFVSGVFTILKRNQFGLILLIALFFVLGAGLVYSIIEDVSFSDGLWYALVTVTTVGYGDVTPRTENGRIFGTVLILLGVVLFSLVTANISAFLIGAEQKRREQQTLHYVRIMGERLEAQREESEAQLEKILSHVTQKVDYLESNMKDFNGQKISEEIKQLEINMKEFNQNLMQLRNQEMARQAKENDEFKG